MQSEIERRRPGRPRKEALRKGELSSRERVLAAAAELFADRGFEGASVDLISERSGYSTAAIYHHFGGKPELAMEVVDYTLSAHNFPSGENGEPAVILDWLNFPLAYLDPANKQLRRLLGEIFTAANRYPDMARRLSAHAENVTCNIVRSIKLAKTRGGVAATTHPEEAARIFMINTAGLIHIENFYPALIGNPRWTQSVLKSLAVVLGISSAGPGPARSKRV
jgi:TetR/AcrR family transcriptional regulator